MPITLKLLALVGSGDVKYSIKENVKNKVSGEIYDKVVFLIQTYLKGFHHAIGVKLLEILFQNILQEKSF